MSVHFRLLNKARVINWSVVSNHLRSFGWKVKSLRPSKLPSSPYFRDWRPLQSQSLMVQRAWTQRARLIPFAILTAVPLTWYATQSQNTLFASDDYAVLEGLASKLEFFEAFATLEEDGEKFMSPFDILRALSIDLSSDHKEITEGERILRSVFEVADLNYDGHISYQEFLFFLRLITTPPELFMVAFNMMDLQNSGFLDIKTFQKILQSKKGNLSIPLTEELKGGLTKELFGKDGKTVISKKEFSKFMGELQFKVHKAQFYHYADPKSGNITGHQFAKLVLSHANLLPNYVPRLRSLSPELQKVEITFEQFLAFENLLMNLRNIMAAMKLTKSRENHYSKSDFLRAARSIGNNCFSPEQVDILFHLLDRHGVHKIGRAEMVAVARRHEKLASDDDLNNDGHHLSVFKLFYNFSDCLQSANV